MDDVGARRVAPHGRAPYRDTTYARLLRLVERRGDHAGECVLWCTSDAKRALSVHVRKWERIDVPSRSCHAGCRRLHHSLVHNDETHGL